MISNYDSWLNDSSAYESFEGIDGYDEDEKDEQYYRDKDADDWYTRIKEEGR